MNSARFDMAGKRKGAERLSATKLPTDAAARWATLKKAAQEAMNGCDRSSEEGSMDHGGLMLFLCAIEDLEKSVGIANVGEREKLALSAAKKFDSAAYQYERA